ncbi:ribonuclease, Rne/Rng family [Thermodesulfatator indicus DSM 15286]|uniref:Ribonuclease G n=1 Tax=Thermodesulfatator indicus (strain DSM 15286 / JCM 11887 / CIR29812) TaxID=667014 RepID=F8ABA1_THEID|nr:Rne/Rng family ribonuclease [Thermodesulfatator indicus]AEH45560.1 ribonuclease, Rne/Rng family [Thermodesulfatator indicus DSM 15286]
MAKQKEKTTKKNKIILINADQPEEVRVALVENGRLEAFDIETVVREHTKGNIYKGRVVNIEPSLQAVFVDIGLSRNGYLPFKEIHPEYYGYAEAVDSSGKSRLPELLEVGQELLVQIVKEETPTKGASLTTYLSLPGRYVVLMPGNPTQGVSKKVEDENKRKRLKDILLGLKLQEGVGVIMRTAAADAAKKNILADLRYLLRLWQEIKKQAAQKKAPALLYRDQDVIVRFLREHLASDVKEILVDTPEALEKIKGFLRLVAPRQVRLAKLFKEERPIFSLFNLEEQIENVFKPVVPLPSGGTLYIEPTEALVAIDVNSGKCVREKDLEETSFKTNLEAAEEIARQLRLRDLGGLVVIDFITMKQTKHRYQVEKCLKEALKKDKAKITVTKFSKLGLIELARQKLQAPLQWGSYRPCPCCRGAGQIRTVEVSATALLRRIKSKLATRNICQLKVKVSPELASYLLNQKRKDLAALEDYYNATVIIEPDIYLTPEETIFEEKKKNSSDIKAQPDKIAIKEESKNLKCHQGQEEKKARSNRSRQKKNGEKSGSPKI